MTRRLVIVSAGMSVPSSTQLLADRLADATAAAVESRGEEVQVDHVELRPLAHALADGLLTGFPTPELQDAMDRVRAADGVVFVTPVYSASYSGLFKTFVDVLEPGALDGTPVLVAATGGTARHSMVLDHALRPLFTYLHATVVPTGVYAASEDFGSTDGGHLDKRIARAAAEMAGLMRGRAEPVAEPRRTAKDEFAEPTPFEQLLRDAGSGRIAR